MASNAGRFANKFCVFVPSSSSSRRVFLVVLVLLSMTSLCPSQTTPFRGNPESFVLTFVGSGSTQGERSDSESDVSNNYNPSRGADPNIPANEQLPETSSTSTTSEKTPTPTPTPPPDPHDVIEMFDNLDSSIYSQDLPTAIKLSFDYSDESVVLDLIRNDNVLSRTPVFVNSSNVRWTIVLNLTQFQDYAFYFDHQYDSSVLVEKAVDEITNSAVLLYSGSFILKSTQFAFEPVTQPSTAKRRKRRSADSSLLERVRRNFDSTVGQLQIIYEVPTTESDPVEIWGEPYLANRLNNTLTLLAMDSDAASAKVNYTVERMAVIDYRLYLRFYNFSNFTLPEDKFQDAINNIRFYIGHVFNGIDMRYQSINDSTYSITTTLVAFYIATDASDAPFVEDHRTDGYPLGTIDASAVLTDFVPWLITNQGYLPNYDEATIFTSENMIGAENTRIAGLAVIKGICTRYSVAIVKDEGEYSTTETGAHELGHNLGCGHDGIDNTCDANALFIMSAAPGLLTDDVYKNAYHFSTCSISEMRIFLSYLLLSPSASDHCLVIQNSPILNMSGILAKQSGQQYDPDEQCDLMLGPGSYYCGGLSEDQQICRTMQCYSPQDYYCYATFEQEAFPGTTCGNKMWCQESDCVYSPEAPEAKAECTYGDYKGPYSNGLTCALIVSSAQWNCYDPGYYNDCCQGCPSISNNSWVGCEYGDHDVTCSTMGLYNCYEDVRAASCCVTCDKPGNISGCEYGDKAGWCLSFIESAFDCYAQAGTCCNTCRQYDTGIANCRYGDQAAWCSNLSSSLCYTSFATCCQTCAKIRNSAAVGCEYGDKADWCSTVQSYDCYSEADSCCQSCAAVNTNISGCEYGDKVPSCSPSFCTDPDLLDDCCLTCSSISPTTKETTTMMTTTLTTTKKTRMPTKTPYEVTSSSSAYPGTIDCAVGNDSASYCSTMPVSNCYSLANTCCQTCRQNYVMHDGCEYGDRAVWCQNFVQEKSNCLQDGVSFWCCEICAATYGVHCNDTKPSCTTIQPVECYDDDVQSTYCCATCQQFRIGNQAGCDYGDKEAWCVGMNPSLCGEYSNICCQTCQSVL